MRLVSTLVLAAFIALPCMADSAADMTAGPDTAVAYTPGQEPGLYRFGATYEFGISATASDCQVTCDSESACFAWSFVEGIGESETRCELKRGGGRIEHNFLATSGISSRHAAKFAVVTENAELEGGPDIAPPPSSKPDGTPTPLVATDSE